MKAANFIRRSSIAVGLVAGFGLMSAARGAEPATAQGVVFEDRNGNGQRDDGEPGVAGVAVSNQEQVVLTDAQGRYALPVTDDTIVFVTKPSGYRLPLSPENLPQFFYIHKPGGSPKLYYPGVAPTGPLPDSIDFPLIPQTEPDFFTIIALADTQPETSQELEYVRDDVFSELVGTDAAFAVTLGDIVSDQLWLLDGYKDYAAKIGIPFYNVIGNHDMNYDAEGDRDSDETFHRHFGPNYYSWDYAQVHFVAMDTIIWLGPGHGTGHYQEGIEPRQLTWLANDLKVVPRDKLVVLLMHAPLATCRSESITGTKVLFEILKDRPRILALAGHTHLQEHVFLGPGHGWAGEGDFHELICVTVCGSWWSGLKDVRGIPVADQREGTPNGYVTIEFNGTDYTSTYKAAGFDRSYQMRIYPPGGVDLSEEGKNKLLVNVFDGSERSVVEYSLDRAPFQPMTRTPQLDPLSVAMFSGVTETGKSWVRATICPHFWEAKLPVRPARGTHVVTVRVRDHYGRTFDQSRIFRFR